jgi:hypothetical protein
MAIYGHRVMWELAGVGDAGVAWEDDNASSAVG